MALTKAQLLQEIRTTPGLSLAAKELMILVADAATEASAGSGFPNPATENLNMDGNNIVGPGTVDGRDVSVDGTKLDTVESGAQVNRTAAELKTDYESNADTNAFTDAQNSKLAGIQAGATAGIGSVAATSNLDMAGFDIVNVNNSTNFVATQKLLTGGAMEPLNMTMAGEHVAEHADPATSGGLSVATSEGAGSYSYILYQADTAPALTGIMDDGMTSSWSDTGINIIIVLDHADGTKRARHAGLATPPA